MHKMEANEIVGTTFYTINTILAQGYNGPDALALYFKYIEQTRIQQTNITWSLDVFMKKKMGWGDSRFKKAKKILRDLGSIDLIQKRDSLGRVKTIYVKVNFLINENKIRKSSITYEIEPNSMDTHSVDIPPNGEGERNALSTKHKCLKNLKERDREKFIEEMKTFFNDEKLGQLRMSIYPKDLRDAFISYWTEPFVKGKYKGHCKYVGENTRDIVGRLDTFLRRRLEKEGMTVAKWKRKQEMLYS